MPDYKAMYYHLTGRMETTMEVLEVTMQALNSTTTALMDTTNALTELTEKLKKAQLLTEEMFITSEDPLEDEE